MASPAENSLSVSLNDEGHLAARLLLAAVGLFVFARPQRSPRGTRARGRRGWASPAGALPPRIRRGLGGEMRHRLRGQVHRPVQVSWN